MTFWRRWTETNIEKLLRLNLQKLEKIMTALEDLKNAAADIAATEFLTISFRICL